MNTSRWRGVVAAYGGLLLMAGCGESGEEEVGEQSGRVQVVMMSSALSAADISQIHTRASSAAWGRTFETDLVQNGSQWTGSLEALPVGTDWSFSGQAFDLWGQLAYQGVVEPVTIEADRTAFVALNLDQVPAAVPFENSSPRIQALTASAIEVQPLDLVTLSVQAVDPDNDPLTYEWSSDAGTFSLPGNRRTVWTAPRKKGTYPIQLQVYDPRGLSATVELQVTVLTDLQEGRAEITTTINSFPVVNQVWAKPTPIAVGEPVSLGVDAVDPDGDVLTYAWSSSCEGTFDATDVDFPYFTLTSLPESGSCVFTVQVDDGRTGHNYGTANVAAGSNPDVVIGVPQGSPLTAPGEAYAHDGMCSGWNACGNAQTCALWACQANGYADLVSYGAEGLAEQFTVVNLLLNQNTGGILFDWSPGDKSWCPLMAVTDIVCQ